MARFGMDDESRSRGPSEGDLPRLVVTRARPPDATFATLATFAI
jgi:hypothetical protein